MRLSDLKTGEEGIIVKVNGHGGFRKRIVEMGFIKGEEVAVLLNAPLKDPVKYRLMGYEVSLRREEASLIEVVSKSEANMPASQEAGETSRVPSAEIPATASRATAAGGAFHCEEYEQALRRLVSEKSHELTVCLVGNPNCGKTSLFNYASGAHERVGNYSGVTVDAKEGVVRQGDYLFHVVDLPGTYSLTTYTPEELYVRKYIVEKTPSLIINVVDASNLERNLYLTTQLIDMDVPMVMALNMYDELRESGDKLDTAQLGRLLGVPVVPTVGRTGEGVKELFQRIIDIYEGRDCTFRHIHVNHGAAVETQIACVESQIRRNPEPHFNYSARFLSIKMLEGDRQIEQVVRRFGNASDIFAARDSSATRLKKELGDTAENAITDAKYGFIQGALKECYQKRRRYTRHLTYYLDAVVTHPVLGYPIFLVLMYLMFFCTFSLGQYPMDWIDGCVGWLGDFIVGRMPEGPLRDLLVDGIIGGVGGVIVFLPNIMILYLFISWMEDSGYMARTAFIMDKIMHRMGLHGKSFIPMIMGFGCNIPAIMSTRTIEDRKSRLVTMLIVPLMSCSARLPVYIIIIGAFFPRHAALVLLAVYLLGILMSVFMANLLSRLVVRGESSPFVMELPPYRLPSMKSVARHTWEKGRQYLQKMGTTILLASIVVWALAYFPRGAEGVSAERQMEQSFMGRIGKAVEPVIGPCGFGWKEGVSLIAGVGAKEIVASTMGVLYSASDDGNAAPQGAGEEEEEEDEARLSRLIAAQSGLTPLSAFAFLVFILLYMPCLPACVAIKNESGGWKWAAFTIAYTTSLAWLCATLVFQVGSLFGA